MTRVCVVKQHTTYDLFTSAGTDPRKIVESSNWRTGPIGLWEAFACDAKVVWEDPARECQIGKSHWGKYVEGWSIWPDGRVAESSEAVDWSIYDIVISVDVAIPTRIVRRYPEVMWCYYFIECSPRGIYGRFRGSPFFNYNVFLNHRLAKKALTAASREVRSMLRQRRAVLDFPYYVMSAHSIQELYPEYAVAQRSGIVLSHHSYSEVSREEETALVDFGGIRRGYSSISDIHRLELQSKSYVVHPRCKACAGLGLIEAISAGCLAVAPRNRLWGFPELINEGLDYLTFCGMLEILSRLEESPELYERERARQADLVDEWCFKNPVGNLEYMLEQFRSSHASPSRQAVGERLCQARAFVERPTLKLLRKGRSLWRRLAAKR